MKKAYSILALVLVLTMILPFAACGGGAAQPTPEPESTQAPAENTPAAPTDVPPEETEGEASMYPIVADDLTLTYWTDFNSPAGAYLSGYGDFPAMQKSFDITGVTIEFTNFSPPQAHEQFPIMIASGEYPDIVRNFLSFYGASGAQAYEEGIIIEMTDLIYEYAPDYIEVLESDPTNYLDAVDDESKMWVLWSFSKEYYPIEGFTLRADWLEELGLAKPDSLEAIEAYLLGAKTEFGAAFPYLLSSVVASGGSNPFAHAYGVGGYNSLDLYDEFFHTDGTVHYSCNQEGYREYLTLMHKWYEAGLISSDFVSTEFSVKEGANLERISTGATALWVSQTQNFVDYRTAATDADFELVGMGNVNADGGDETYLSTAFKRHNRYCYAISTQCENPEVAVQWMNFWYTEYGSDLSNYGEEGEDWEWVDGRQTFTEKIRNNTELTDLSITQVANYYTLYNQVTGYFDQTRLFQLMGDVETDAIAAWGASKKGDYVIPLGVSLTIQEHEVVKNTMADIRSYVEENASQFITGDRDLSTWDDFAATIEDLGIQDCIAAYQSAVDRYYSR